MKKRVDEKKQGSVVLYKNHIEVKLEEETVWLDTHQMADLFGVDRTGIVRHIQNIYKTKELFRKTTCAKNAQIAKDGKVREMDFYNLDMIISVGYRVNSKKGTQFRIWATDVLRKHLTDGYTLNEKRLKCQADKVKELAETVSLLKNVAMLEDVSDESKGIIQIITEYTKALDILDDYDRHSLKTPKGTKRSRYRLTHKKARVIIDEIKRKFKDSSIVGQEKDLSFRATVGTIYQTYEGRELYPTIEEKAAHLLYFAIKNHSFVDGNKRIAAALFVCFLQDNEVLFNKKGKKRINDSTLVALTLMIASSKPSEKEILIKVILNLIS